MENIEAESMVKHIEDVLFNDPKPICRPLFPSQHLTNRVVKLGEGMKYFYHQDGSNPSDENSALVHYIQVIPYSDLEGSFDIYSWYCPIFTSSLEFLRVDVSVIS